MFLLQQIHSLLMGILTGNENCHSARSVAYWTIPSGNLSWFGSLHLRTLFYTVLYKYGRLLNKQTLHCNGWWFQYICCTHRRLKMPCPDSYKIMSIDVTHFDQRNRCWNAWTCIGNVSQMTRVPGESHQRWGRAIEPKKLAPHGPKDWMGPRFHQNTLECSSRLCWRT